MQSKEEKIFFLVGTFSIIALVCLGIGLYKIGYDKGYQDGQINYSLGKIKYAVMDGIKVHFYGFVDKEIKEE